jgi:hypothetical protein
MLVSGQFQVAFQGKGQDLPLPELPLIMFLPPPTVVQLSESMDSIPNKLPFGALDAN